MNRYKFKESEGKRNNKEICCPVDDFTCPYYIEGICYIENPIEDCGDFGSCYSSWEEWEET